MQQIDFNNIRLKGESKQKSFEDLCMFLCCRELKITEIDSYHNQPGIETEPFEAKGKKYGFQAKFFEGKFDWNQIKKSITKAIKLYPELDIIFIYSNKKRSKTNKIKKELEIQAKKKKIVLKYITDDNIKLKLSQPSNLDLAQLYFGVGDELGFVNNSVNTKLLTFIQSSEYLELPFEDNKKSKIDKVSEKIISETSKVFLLLGNPGSGKSFFMHKLLETFGGLDKKKQGEMIKVLTDNNAVPMLVNVKNCITDSLENILRGRKNDSKVNSQELGFIYIFDGLDELTEEIADNILFQIYELSQKSNTKKIIISCRSGNINRLKAKTYFNDVVEYKISDLEEQFIDDFFRAKTQTDKKDKLVKLKKNNKHLIKEIKDILLIKLFWDTINELNESSSILDLFDKKINLLLDNPKHRKNIENLNLLNFKKNAIIELNQDISFEFQKKFQFRFSQKDLQGLILKKFERLDYKSINAILDYIAGLFFENSYLDNFTAESAYIYQHRRYQEYFFTQRLKFEYENNPRIIRELKILSNREYFEELFLKHLKKEYQKENNLAGFLELNLIDVYLGKHEGFGADDDYYVNSNEFIPALVAQEINVFNELFEDENLQIKDKISIDFTELKKQFEKWKKNKNDYRSTDYLKSIWERGFSSLIENIVLFWEADKKDVANEFIIQFKKIRKFYEDNKIIENLKGNEHISNPFWNQFEDLVYYRLIIKNEDIKYIFNNLIRKNYDNFSKDKGYSFKESGKEKLVKSFFRICLKNKKEKLFELIDNFDEYEFIAFLDVLKTINYLPIFIQSKSIHKKIKTFVNKFSQELNEKNIFIIFYKKFLNITISKKEEDSAESEFSKLREKRSIDLHMDKTYINFLLLSYTLDKFSFEELLKKQEGHPFRYYLESNLYSALFNDFIDLLKEKKKIEAIVRDYIRYINFYTEGTRYRQYLKVDISFLWANIIANSASNTLLLLQLKEILIKEENNIIPSSFYLQLNRSNTTLFYKIVNESELKQFEDELLSWQEDFPSYVDSCFDLSMFYSQINPKRAKYYFEKGIIEGILRHGWRKDNIVSYQLVDALKILWRNHWETKENLEKYSKEVFELALRVKDITDGKGTWQGPYYVIEVVADYNLELAEKFKKELIKKEGYSNWAITSILKSKINLGFPIEEIEKEMNEYRRDYDYQGKPESDYYEQRFIVYLKIAENELYTDKEKKNAFEKTYKEVEEIKKQKMNYYLRDDVFKNEKLKFQKLCKRYNKKFNLEFDKKEKSEINFSKKRRQISEDQFIKEVEACSNKRQLVGKYKKLDNYNNGIVLSKYESWKILVEKTFEINENIKILTNYLMKNNFPHSDFWTHNSKYFHFALAVALKNINTRQEILKYLFKNSGHGGFTNIMRAYEILGDKNMCLLLFNRFLRFCGLIVN